MDSGVPSAGFGGGFGASFAGGSSSAMKRAGAATLLRMIWLPAIGAFSADALSTSPRTTVRKSMGRTRGKGEGATRGKQTRMRDGGEADFVNRHHYLR
eukprot:scaffold276768_cov33-Tisochrysis_lutea.AAC.2